MFPDFDSKLEISHKSHIYFDIPFHRTRNMLFINAVIEKVIAEMATQLIGVYGAFKVPYGMEVYDVSIHRIPGGDDVIEIYVSLEGSFKKIEKRIYKQQKRLYKHQRKIQKAIKLDKKNEDT